MRGGQAVMVKLRTLKECYKYIKSVDTDTAMTSYFLRQMVVQKKVPYMRASRKYLINLKLLGRFMSHKLLKEKHAKMFTPNITVRFDIVSINRNYNEGFVGGKIMFASINRLYNAHA